MTKTQRQNFFGKSEKRNFGSTPQHEAARQGREAEARGKLIVAQTHAALANDPASSANRKAAAAKAQQRNAEAIRMLNAGGGLGFNPLATKKS
jgi:hypothetical protein